MRSNLGEKTNAVNCFHPNFSISSPFFWVKLGPNQPQFGVALQITLIFTTFKPHPQLPCYQPQQLMFRVQGSRERSLQQSDKPSEEGEIGKTPFSTEAYFTLGPINWPSKWSIPIGHILNIGSIGFTLGPKPKNSNSMWSWTWHCWDFTVYYKGALNP